MISNLNYISVSHKYESVLPVSNSKTVFNKGGCIFVELDLLICPRLGQEFVFLSIVLSIDVTKQLNVTVKILQFCRFNTIITH